MLNRMVIVLGIIAAIYLWFGPSPLPRWAVVVFVLVLLATGVVISVKRMRAERRLMRTFWNALTGR